MKHDILLIVITQKAAHPWMSCFLLKLTIVEPLSPVSLLNIYMLSQNLFGKECKRHFDKIRDDERKTHMPSAEA